MADDLAGNLADLKKQKEFMGGLRDFGAEASAFLNGGLRPAAVKVKSALGVDDLSAVTAANIQTAFPNAPDGWANRAARYVRYLDSYTTKIGADLTADKLPPTVSDDVL